MLLITFLFLLATLWNVIGQFPTLEIKRFDATRKMVKLMCRSPRKGPAYVQDFYIDGFYSQKRITFNSTLANEIGVDNETIHVFYETNGKFDQDVSPEPAISVKNSVCVPIAAGTGSVVLLIIVAALFVYRVYRRSNAIANVVLPITDLAPIIPADNNAQTWSRSAMPISDQSVIYNEIDPRLISSHISFGE
ncbi:hypothetical protein DPMN_039186, partial [Dreissena polymorpha]